MLAACVCTNMLIFADLVYVGAMVDPSLIYDPENLAVEPAIDIFGPTIDAKLLYAIRAGAYFT